MQIVFPVGRFVGGSLVKMYPRTDKFNKPILKADGTPEASCSIACAVRKGAEQHWNQTPWGAQIFGIGKAAYPAEHAVPTFAWKITDGDSTTPNRKNRKPCDNENYRGHWVLRFSQSWLPKTVLLDASGHPVEIPGDRIPLGYFIRVVADVKSNAPSQSPGVYLNPQAVILIAEGDEIASEVDLSAVSALPAEPLPAGARPLASALPAFSIPQSAPTGVPQAATPAAPAPVVPNPAFLQVPPKPAHQMTPAANGATYEAMIAAGWTDALLVQHGMML